MSPCAALGRRVGTGRREHSQVEPALIDGAVGLVVAPYGRLLLALRVPDVVRDADLTALPEGRAARIRGARAVAEETVLLRRNARFAARATGEGLAPTELHAAYYGQRAGAGLIVTEGTWVSERAIGGRIVRQLWHTGAASHPDHLGGELPAGPSAVDPCEKCFTANGFKETVTPRAAMSLAAIEETVEEYRAASENARRAGFDGVEIGALGVFPPAQFLNPRLNRRTDAYGCDRARRRRPLLDVVDATAAAWGRRGVGVRLSPWWTGGRFTADAATRRRSRTTTNS
ncbi:hypothetical protein ABZY36_05095 [Streptomyces sp. NPDC006627]|uniref:oxidoreductase n=1 Tax=Streptomyces sp. NPDC006627 TaxID=3154679 RepID=UPI0033A7D3E8